MSLFTRRLKLLPFVLCVWVFYSCLSSAHVANVRSFHTVDGLAHEIVRDIVGAPDGSVWFATWGGGISHFDGMRWETFRRSDGLPSDSIRVLFHDGEKAMWAGTADGIAHFDGVTWRAVCPAIPGLATPSVYCIAEMDDGALWFGTAEGQIVGFRQNDPRTHANKARTSDLGDARIPEGMWSIVLNRDLTRGHAVRDILQLADGEIWAAVDALGIAVHDGKEWRLRWEGDAVAEKILSLFQSEDGSVWAAGGHILHRWDGESWRPVQRVCPESVCVTGSADGGVFVGTRNGLWIWREGDWENPPLSDDVPHPEMETVSCLKDGTTWIGTQCGAYRIAPMLWLLYERTTDGVPLNGLSLYADPDTAPVTVDSRSRLVRFDGGVWEPIAQLDANETMDESFGVNITHPYDNKIWVQFRDRALQFSLDEHAVTYSVPVPPAYQARNLFQTRQGHVYLLCKTGIYELIDGQWQTRPADLNYNRRSVREMYEDQQGGLWLELADGVERWKGDKIEPFVLNEAVFGHNRVSAICCARDGRVWFGTSGSGLICWDKESYRQITVRDGLPSNVISPIYESFDGTLWVSTRSLGISSYRDGRWVSYTHAEGLAGRTVRAIGEYPEGVIWLAIQNGGLACYRPGKEAPDTTIREYQQTIAPHERGVFGFSGLDVWKRTLQKDLVFSWRLLPRAAAPDDVKWSAFSGDSVVVTPPLRPGRYTFQVRAADKDRNIDLTPAGVDFEVLLPIWKTLTFLVPVFMFSGVACVALALVHRKHRALKASEKRHRQLVESINDVIYVVDESGIITYISPVVKSVVSYTPLDLIGRSFLTFVHPDHVPGITDEFQRVLSGDSLANEYRFLDKSGDTRWMRNSWQPKRIGDRVIGAYGIMTDITSRKRAEEALRNARDELEERVVERTRQLTEANEELQKEIAERKRAEEALGESEERYRALFEQAADSIVLIDGETGALVEFNDKAHEALGYTREEFERLKVHDIEVIESAEEVANHIQILPKEGDDAFETKHRTKGGEIRDINVTFKTISIGERDYIHAMWRDITERKRLEEQLRQSQKMEAIGQLAGGVAHDFNNLLTGVIGNLALAEMDAPREICEFLAAAKEISNRMAILVRQLLAFSRKSRVALVPVDLNRIVHEVYRLARETIDRRIEITIHAEEDLPNVRADATQISSVLINLSANARDAINEVMYGDAAPERRRDQFVISIETETVVVGPEYCERYTYARPGRFAVVSVSDNGAGMDPETQRHLFEPFFTTKEVGKGTGLGLASVYGIVKQHDGWINAFSELAKGTTFKIYLPVAAKETQPDDNEKHDEVRGGTETILLVDDEEVIRNLGKKILERYGYTVLLAADGHEGLNLYLNQRDRIDLIILDISMPHVSGYEFLDRLRFAAPEAKVIISTGYAEHGDPELPQRLDVVAYVAKPYQALELVRRVREVLDTP